MLWNDFLRHNPSNPKWPDRDRFVLSNGHGSMLIYSLLHLTGYDLPLDELKISASCIPRPRATRNTVTHRAWRPPPVRSARSITNAVGMAIAEKALAGRFNQKGHDIVDHHTYVFLGDGCLMEGISHEACSLAGTLGPRQADCLLGRQRHFHRRPRRRLVYRQHADAF